MSTKYEVVLVWSHELPQTEIGERRAKAFNKVFKDYPTDEVLQGVVAEKQGQIEAAPHAFPNPEMHRLEVRTVETKIVDLQPIIDAWNDGQPEEI